MQQQCLSKILIITSDQNLISILKEILKFKNFSIYTSTNIEDINCDYCLIIIGPDISMERLYEKIKQLKGILPHFLILENGKSCKWNSLISCKCKKVSLPMEIFYIEKHIEEILNIYF